MDLKITAAGKHVQCSKPIGLNLSEATLMEEVQKKYPDLRVMEAFMYKFHLQWGKVKSLITSGSIGALVKYTFIFLMFNWIQTIFVIRKEWEGEVCLM